MILLAFLLAFTLLRTSIADQCTTFRSGVACTVCAEYKKLLAFPDDDPLLQECRNCCSTTADLLLQREYSSAVLQVNRMMLQQFGGVNEWLEKSASKWQGRVEIQDTFNNAPLLYFRNSEDEVNDASSSSSSSSSSSTKKTTTGKKTKSSKSTREDGSNQQQQYVNIGSWQIEHIDNFLTLKLGKD